MDKLGYFSECVDWGLKRFLLEWLTWDLFGTRLQNATEWLQQDLHDNDIRAGTLKQRERNACVWLLIWLGIPSIGFGREPKGKSKGSFSASLAGVENNFHLSRTSPIYSTVSQATYTVHPQPGPVSLLQLRSRRLECRHLCCLWGW